MSLSFSNKANVEKGAAIDAVVTLQEIIGAACRDIGGRILKNQITLVAIPNNAGITQIGLNETALRMSRGGLVAELIPHVLADANVTNGSPSDSVVENAILWAIWPIALLITIGKA
jgi:hypothetical protein